MALIPSKVLRYPAVLDQAANSNRQATLCTIPDSARLHFHSGSQVVSLRRSRSEHHNEARPNHSSNGLWSICRRHISYAKFQRLLVQCHSKGTPQTKSREDNRHTGECADIIGEGIDEKDNQKSWGGQKFASTSQGLANAYKYAYNDAKLVNERARQDIVLLSRGLRSLDARARQDVAILGSEFLKLDARAREDTEKIDYDVKRKAEYLHHIATILRDKAKSRLKTAADQHWSDGALEADLRRADLRAKKRAMEDTLMALEFVKNIHDIMVSKMYNFPIRRKNGSLSQNIMLEKNGKALDFFPGEVSNDRISAIQEAYWSMAAALSEADGVDYTDPEELELLITTLIDLDAMDGKSSVSLLAECSSSPDVNTRQALANALAAAPSMWTLGNAGMGALQRLAEDSDPAVAAAASMAINELKQQWEIQEGDSWRFMLDNNVTQEDGGFIS
ncbi:senescence-associated protein AAF, chlorolplastic isoform X2 [Amaranthus tricolor]|uniref:senescence-associated protein AAF, chlorolplastic isoform X2 n=1 Tax=Amaranthus tricolor TaxID=29722 RepID=UPI002583EC9D|nr:senescence-associated protein AAF, chlorolplastic isoform X2 [Amaranthus tricolor]